MIKLENISKYYVGNNEVALGLRKINLEFEKGELVAITGESGSGKSTLLNVLSGSDSYEDGEMYIGERATSYFDERDWEAYRRDYIGFIYQSYMLIESYTVFENVNAALVVKGKINDTTDKVYSYLEKVGIADLADHRATQLSSGQKQRLAIARALAKETPILVADEPTGNLDSENSAQIMSLLNELSAEKLVIVVTHNFDEMEQYATRKIRMFDGEVAEDIKLREKKVVESETEDIISTEEEKTQKKEQKKKANKKSREVANRIAYQNRRSRPVLTAFLILFMIVASSAFFILLGSFFVNLDNSTSKIYSDTYFLNGDTRRIIVRNYDGTAFSSEDVEKIQKVGRVESVELYDGITDAYCLLVENQDYEIVNKVKEDDYSLPSHKTVRALSNGLFIRSQTCITESDLLIGNMPENLYDIVVYSDDESLLGQSVRFYIGKKNDWGNQLARVTCNVVGLLKRESDTVYFSEEFASMISVSPNDILDQLLLGYADSLEGLTITDQLTVKTLGYLPKNGLNNSGIYDDSREGFDKYNGKDLYNEICAINNRLYNFSEYTITDLPIFIINEDLSGNDVKLSNEAVNKTSRTNLGNGKTIVHMLGSSMVLSLYNQEGSLDWQVTQEDEKYNTTNVFSLKFTATLGTTLSTQRVMEVGRDLYDKIVFDKDSYQMSVFIKDYAYTEDVIDDIEDLGYEAASVYRVGATEYDYDIVNQKATSMIVSIAACVMIFFIGIFITGTIMNINITNFRVFKLLGLDGRTINETNVLDVSKSMIFSVGVSLLIILILNVSGVSFIANIVKYYKFRHYVVYILVIALYTYVLIKRREKRMRNVMN